MFEDFSRFLQASPTPYHAVATTRERLLAAGFSQLDETEQWTSMPGAKQFVVRSDKSIAAWRVGASLLHESGLRIVGAHTDSPALKPRTNRIDLVKGAALLNVSIYGSPIVQTWLDRDLGLAGAAFLDGGNKVQLFAVSDTRVRASSLAIHLDKSLRTNGMQPNTHKHLNCHFGSAATTGENALIELVAGEIGCAANEIAGADISLYDPATPELIGYDKSTISAGRLDNLFSCYCALEALIGSQPNAAQTQMMVLFDAEEIGSRTSHGAQSTFLGQTIERLVAACETDRALDPRQLTARTLAQSSLLSLDMAHGLHPLYPETTDAAAVPVLNGGPAIKSSTKGHYASSGKLQAQLLSVAAEKGLSVQHFSYRNDLGGGTSIGPLVAANLGVETIDMGAPLLSMHSIRELAGVDDLKTTIELLRDGFFTL